MIPVVSILHYRLLPNVHHLPRVSHHGSVDIPQDLVYPSRLIPYGRTYHDQTSTVLPPRNRRDFQILTLTQASK